ncbi:MAG: ABC-F family ATP-binding cassette domain-containing protein [Deltaproteobacteria bacterium]|nr:ABC-F family ATP-binding cassette domain-containing protein [Deltaproteobacteria bacterium]
MPVLTAQHLSKSFGARTLLDDVSLTLRSAERVGLVGANGSGKSTLARILAGVEPADGGSIAQRRGATVVYLGQDPSLPADQTAREVVASGLTELARARARHEALGLELPQASADRTPALLAELAATDAEIERLGGWDVQHRVESIMGHLGIARPDARVDAMSGGERRRVGLARALVSRPSLLILDEPTNHLEIEAIEWLEQFLVEDHEGALLLITHDRYVLDNVVQRTLELERGHLHAYEGGYEAYLEAKAEREDFEARTEQNRRNFLRRELEWLRRRPKARTGKQKARIQRAESARADRPPPEARAASMSLEAVRTGKTILELRDVAIEVGGRRLVTGLTFALTAGDRVGIVGKNGSGKTTLLRAILGEHPIASGSLVVGQSTRIAFLDQERTGLDPALSIFDNVAGARARVEIGGRSLDMRSYLEQFLFDTDQQRQPVGSVSGGERARVALARMLLGRANLVMLDEPTNDLDVSALGALEAMLIDFDGSALVVTHDRWFLDRVATSILAFEDDGRVVHYPGSYDVYRSLRAARDEERANAAAAASPPPSRTQPPPQVDTRKKGLSWAERNELEGIMTRIADAEGTVARLEAELADPSLYASGSGADVKDRITRLERARHDVSTLMERWEQLETKRGTI